MVQCEIRNGYGGSRGWSGVVVGVAGKSGGWETCTVSDEGKNGGYCFPKTGEIVAAEGRKLMEKAGTKSG